MDNKILIQLQLTPGEFNFLKQVLEGSRDSDEYLFEFGYQDDCDQLIKKMEKTANAGN